MNYLPLLNKDEIHYVCSVIPHQHTIDYFRQNPEEFAKIRPGFRAISISKTDAGKLLFNYRDRDFISSFIEKHIGNWLTQIKEHLQECINDGDDKNLALIHTLPFCYFANNICLYFKLVNEEYSEEYIALMDAAIEVFRDTTEKQEELERKTANTESECEKIQVKLDRKTAILSRNKDELSNKSLEIGSLENEISSLNKHLATSKEDKEEIKLLKKENRRLLSKIDKLSIEINEVKNNSSSLKEQIRDELEKRQKYIDEAQYPAPDPKCPCDMDEFKEYLEYNFIDIGVPNDAEYFPLLLSHLSKILFGGIPIMVNHAVGKNLIKCVANALIGKPTVKMMAYNKEITVEDINKFLSSSGRLVCLENFIGNYNETKLIPLMDRHGDKIIFLTTVYDRTLYYLSKEFLRYCHYFNANRIGALSTNVVLSEDPSMIMEHSYVPDFISGRNRFRDIFRNILYELNFPRGLIEYKCEFISSEQDLCQSLIFDILPFCTDVLRIKPYNVSERLFKYAGTGGRCPQNNLFMRWFF